MWKKLGFSRIAPLLVLVLLLPQQRLSAQELRCMVQVVAPGIQGTNREVFETLQTSIMEFMNSQSWTEHVYQNEERIECSIMINIREQIGSDEFKGTLQIQARRPVFNSSYSSPLINFQDQNLHFRYVEFEPLVYNANNMESNLVAILLITPMLFWVTITIPFLLRGARPIFVRLKTL